NTGEAGIGEWLDSVVRAFPNWRVYLSSRLSDSEYAAGSALGRLNNHDHVIVEDDLHLGVSMRSFRAEHLSLLVKQVLDLDVPGAHRTLCDIGPRYPVVITRSLDTAKRWLRGQARGSERYGIVVSSRAERLKPDAIDVKSPVNPIHWFLNGREDVRSSYYMEDVATEFHVQGLELDWTCIVWDADFRHTPTGWDYWEFRGTRWNRIAKQERKTYLKNAYRVLLTRARQGMVIVVPDGNEEDPTRCPAYYHDTYRYLRDIGFDTL
ncbi:MAG: DUF2075 domain-containing protein, partial [Planctomycetes bacterium]|nr:DUF2075 domain-containing protein [Planctomycetota bacterium]